MVGTMEECEVVPEKKRKKKRPSSRPTGGAAAGRRSASYLGEQCLQRHYRPTKPQGIMKGVMFSGANPFMDTPDPHL